LALARSGELKAQQALRAVDRKRVGQPDLAQWMAIAQYEEGSDDAFADVRTILQGGGASRYVFAAIDAVKQRRDARAFDQLVALMSDPMFAAPAAQAILRIDPERLPPLLGEAIQRHRSDDVRPALVRLVSALPPTDALDATLERLLDTPMGSTMTCAIALTLARLKKPLRAWAVAASFGAPNAPPLPYRATLKMEVVPGADWHLCVELETIDVDAESLDLHINGTSLGALEPLEQTQFFAVPGSLIHAGDNDVELVGPGRPPPIWGVAFFNEAAGDAADASVYDVGPVR
jgi:hypothetical protein